MREPIETNYSAAYAEKKIRLTNREIIAWSSNQLCPDGIKCLGRHLTQVDELDYEHIVALHHENLYRFAFSLAGNGDDAAELTQETYVRLLTKGRQLRDRTKVKAWLFTTLYRIFAGWKRQANRFPHLEICSVEGELPAITPELAGEMDRDLVMETALELNEHFRAPLVLYYLQSLTYREIAHVLDLPIGTVMSRLSRGKDILRQRLANRNAPRHAATSNLISPQPYFRTKGQ